MQQRANGRMGAEPEGRRVRRWWRRWPVAAARARNLAEVAHDARNMVTALGLYCDLLEEPGVLATLISTMETSCAWWPRPAAGWWKSCKFWMPGAIRRQLRRWDGWCGEGPGEPRNWRSVQAGPPLGSYAGGPDRQSGGGVAGQPQPAGRSGRPFDRADGGHRGGALPVRLTGEDLTRVLVNLVKNAAEAMPAGGKILLSLRERPGGGGSSEAFPDR
jgi:hypothetical protein